MRHSLRTELLSSTMAHAPSCAKAAALPDGPTRFQVKTTSPNGSVPKPSMALLHTSENWVASRRVLSRVSRAWQ